MTLQENTTIRTKIGAGIATPREVAAVNVNPLDPTDWQNVKLVALSERGREVAVRIAAEVERDRASTDLVTMADAQTAIDASQWGAWL